MLAPLMLMPTFADVIALDAYAVYVGAHAASLVTLPYAMLVDTPIFYAEVIA